ncbi:MAG TPA: DEAD/DEAH box helicase, partial [Rhodanobacteraceae bacterium]|nr:DEAD/DEAH box helicase [Rhodanobacteraceae bacterium]
MQPLSALKGVGPALSSALARLGLERVQDVWFHLPLRYEDRTRLTPVDELVAGQPALVEGVVEMAENSFRYRPQLRVALVDDQGGTLLLRFFHFRRAQVESLRPGARLRCFGEVRFGTQGPEMVHPQYSRVVRAAPLEQRLTPVYPSTEGLGQKRLARVVEQALECLPPDIQLELIPEALRAPLGLDSLREALLCVHRPPVGADVAKLVSGQHPALQRLAFEELLAQHLGLKQLRTQVRKHRAPRLAVDEDLKQRFLDALPFHLTGAQQRVATEVARDMAGNEPMLRLVQGDVGSGKTVVAALAALAAVGAGHQVALMAPTELLAEQHLVNFRAWLEPLGIKVTWLAGKVQ